MTETFFGAWSLSVVEKEASYEERVIINGSENSDGIVDGQAGNFISEISGLEWTAELEWSNDGGVTWYSSAIVRSMDIDESDGITVSLLADDEPEVGDGDFNDLVVELNYLDEVHGTSSSDVIKGIDGTDLIYALGGNDQIDSGLGNDVVYGGSGNDTLRGGAGENNLGGGVGNDNLYGGDETDTFNCGYGNDYVESGGGRDSVVADDGADIVYADAGDDAIGGGGGNDTIYGNAGNDVLDGGPHGDDYLEGGEGDDVMAGYTGNDTLNGGAGADVFIFNPETDGTDTVQDFTPGVDHIYVPDGPSIATIIASETVTPAGNGKVFLGDGQYIVFTNVTGIEESWFL